MRIKFITLLIFAFFAAQVSFAQNTTMAKTFYAKAQQAYADKDYESVISLLEKTKENLNGKTNPDITYLEAKSRYEHDINIKKTKELMNLFMKTADPSDARVKEIAGLLADIEISDNYFENGRIKRLRENGEKGFYTIHYFSENGFKIKSSLFTRSNKVYQTYYFENGSEKIHKLEDYDVKNGFIIRKKYFVNNKPIIQLEIGNYKESELEMISFFNDNGEKIQTITNVWNKNFPSDRWWGNFKIEIVELNVKTLFFDDMNVLEFYPFPENLIFDADDKLNLPNNIGRIKSVKTYIAYENGTFVPTKYRIYNFSEQGKITSFSDYLRKNNKLVNEYIAD